MANQDGESPASPAATPLIDDDTASGHDTIASRTPVANNASSRQHKVLARKRGDEDDVGSHDMVRNVSQHYQ